MNDVFILGSVFTRAISYNKLPTLNSLTKGLKEIIEDLDERPYSSLILNFMKLIGYDNFEDLLSILYQDFPRKITEEKNLHYSLYEYLSKLIAVYIEKCQDKSPTIKNKKVIESKHPDENISPELLDPNLKSFVCRLHNEQIKLVTFNYDTIFEDISRIIIDKYFLFDKKTSKYKDRITCDHFYLMALMRLHKLQVTQKDLFTEYIPTFTLSKLHGSINWHYYGKGSDQIFLASGFFKNVEKVSKEALVPLVIPPVYDKTEFLNMVPIRGIWVRAKESINKADRLFILGYSLPDSDLTVRLMLKYNVKPEAQIYIVDSNIDKKDDEFVLRSNYSNLLGNINRINFDYIKEKNAISDFMRDYGSNRI